MPKKTTSSIIEKAINALPEFESVIRKLEQQVALKDQSESTLRNYSRKIASFVIHFGELPENVEEEQINAYLATLARDPKSPSRSSFKHMVYGLRYYYKFIGLSEKLIALPAISKDTKLPVILNRAELRKLFIAPKLFKHRIALTLIYSAGLRGHELTNLKMGDVDFERKTIHIRQSKYKKDRIVPLSDYMAHGLKDYLKREKPNIWLFNGKDTKGKYSVNGLSWIMREAVKKAVIHKNVDLHSLRHAYATHLLEEGVNIVTLQKLLCHSDISSTMLYLHVAQCEQITPHSPLDTLYHEFTKK